MKALDAIQAEVALQSRRPEAGYQTAKPDLVVMSALAAGADQIGARAALRARGWRLHAILPFDREEYLKDFEGDGFARAEFNRLLGRAGDAVTVLDGRASVPPDGLRGFDAYAPLNQVLLDQCDVLIVVWDGGPARGVGGTSDLVRSARLSDVPLLHLDPHHPKRIVLETRPATIDGTDWVTSLRRQVALLVAPPAAAWGHGDEVDLREAYFAERVHTHRRATLFDLAAAIFHRRAGEGGTAARIVTTLRRMFPSRVVGHPAVDAAREWERQWAGMPSSMREDSVARFAEHFGWADALAAQYAAAFRAAYSRVFALAWLAVVAAFVGNAAERWGGEAVRSTGVSLVHSLAMETEALILLVVFLNVYVGRRRRLHERWIEYRALAEQLRHLGVLWALGRTIPTIRLPPLTLAGDPRGSWVNWYLRGVAREAGVVRASFDADYLLAARRLLRDGEIGRQQHFHEGARDRGRAVVRPLERTATVLFLLALLLALGNLAQLPERMLAWTTSDSALIAAFLGLLGVGLPALASAIHGFLGTSDLESIAIRSAGIAPRLNELRWRLDTLAELDSSTISAIGLEAARLMEGELGSWRAVTAARRLTAV
ncbi:MAG: hypothetical protein V4503_00545 [Gemmatimonadota bacterium]